MYRPSQDQERPAKKKTRRDASYIARPSYSIYHVATPSPPYIVVDMLYELLVAEGRMINVDQDRLKPS
eukprot:9495708-Alexandrium_andersonii.AAC.1